MYRKVLYYAMWKPWDHKPVGNKQKKKQKLLLIKIFNWYYYFVLANQFDKSFEPLCEFKKIYFNSILIPIFSYAHWPFPWNSEKIVSYEQGWTLYEWIGSAFFRAPKPVGASNFFFRVPLLWFLTGMICANDAWAEGKKTS